MKMFLIFLLMGLCGLANAQISSPLVGTFTSEGNKFERTSVMILFPNNRFKYKYAIGACQGEVTGTFMVDKNTLTFENDSLFLNNKNIVYPNLALSRWKVTRIGIKPEREVDSGCLKEVSMHLKEGVIKSEDFNVSIIRLVSVPEKYHGKRVQVMGYLNLEFEGDAIYLHKEDHDKGLNKNAFWVSFSNKLDSKEIHKLNKSYVLIEGRFNMEDLGHMGLFGGTIEDITRIIKWAN
jgi:hypothetical protein